MSGNKEQIDVSLIGNDKIEEAIVNIQKEPTEELKGADNIKSTFLTDIDKLLNSALQVDEISGIIINPWNKTLMIDKELIKIIIGKE